MRFRRWRWIHRKDDWNVLSVNYANLRLAKTFSWLCASIWVLVCSFLFTTQVPFLLDNSLFFLLSEEAWRHFFLFLSRKWIQSIFCSYLFEQSVSLSLLRTAYEKWLNTLIRFIGFCVFFRHGHGRNNVHRYKYSGWYYYSTDTHYLILHHTLARRM